MPYINSPGMKMKHYKDIITKETECGENGEATLDLNEVTCLKCLNLTKKEWERQISFMKGQPLKNAKEGLRRTEERIKLLK